MVRKPEDQKMKCKLSNTLPGWCEIILVQSMNMKHSCRENRHTVRAKQTWSLDDTTFLADGNVPLLSCLYTTGAVCAASLKLNWEQKKQKKCLKNRVFCRSTAKCKINRHKSHSCNRGGGRGLWRATEEKYLKARADSRVCLHFSDYF